MEFLKILGTVFGILAIINLIRIAFGDVAGLIAGLIIAVVFFIMAKN